MTAVTPPEQQAIEHSKNWKDLLVLMRLMSMRQDMKTKQPEKVYAQKKKEEI